jgi:phage gpG-like protein
MATAFRLEVSGLTELLGKLKALNTVLVDEPDIVTSVSAALLNRVRTRYLAQTDPDGGKWKPSKAGLKRQAGGFTVRNGKRYTGTGTGFETGAIFNSIQAFTDDQDQARIGTDIPYAPFFQGPTRYTPERLFMGVGGDDEDFVESVVNNVIDQVLEKAKSGGKIPNIKNPLSGA